MILLDEIEWLMAGDAHRGELSNGFKYPPDDPNRGIDLGWHLKALRADATQLPWRIRLITERSSNTAIGSINLKGAPDAEGDVEIGWGLNEGYFGKSRRVPISYTIDSRYFGGGQRSEIGLLVRAIFKLRRTQVTTTKAERRPPHSPDFLLI